VIEAGLVALIQSGLQSSSPPTIVDGGFAVELPKDQISKKNTMAWSYRFISAEPNVFLNGEDGFTQATVQIDCHGNQMQDAIHLARAIMRVLRGGFRGKLPDPDATYVDSIVRQSTFVDGFSDVNRSFVRSLEYRVCFNQV